MPDPIDPPTTQSRSRSTISTIIGVVLGVVLVCICCPFGTWWVWQSDNVNILSDPDPRVTVTETETRTATAPPSAAPGPTFIPAPTQPAPSSAPATPQPLPDPPPGPASQIKEDGLLRLTASPCQAASLHLRVDYYNPTDGSGSALAWDRRRTTSVVDPSPVLSQQSVTLTLAVSITGLVVVDWTGTATYYKVVTPGTVLVVLYREEKRPPQLLQVCGGS